jgi:preprotein translocase subunit SecG
MLYYLFAAIYVVACLLLLLVVLLQQGRGGDIASAFGGGGSSQTAFGARQGATVLSKATTILGAVFMLGALLLNVLGQQPNSLLRGTTAPARQTTPAPAPAGQKPATTPARAPATPAAPSTTPPSGGTAPAAPTGAAIPGATSPAPVEQPKPTTPPAPKP